jgi:ABC-2 type transport system ATP-binding protein
MAKNIIEVDRLTKKFKKVSAVDAISFTVKKGEVFGFLGPNGAGKTTTVRMLTGVIIPTAGDAKIQDHDISKEPLLSRAHIAVVPEEANVYRDLSVWQNIILMGQLYGIEKSRLIQDAEHFLNTLGLSERKKQKAFQLSKGLRQRLMLAAALVTKPDILFLDEPTGGLDVKSTRLIYQIINDLNRQGLTIFLTTHNMAEAGRLCSRVAIINKGQIVAIDNPESLKSAISSRQYLQVQLKDKGFDSKDWELLPDAVQIESDGLNYKLYTDTPGQLASEVVRLADKRGLQISHLCTCKPTLDEVFLYFTDKEKGKGV